MGKIVTKEAYQKIKKDAKKSGRKVVLCHGVFDLVHPGHIIHFEEAKKMGTSGGNKSYKLLPGIRPPGMGIFPDE